MVRKDSLGRRRRFGRLVISLLSIVGLTDVPSADGDPPTLRWSRTFFDVGDTGTFTIRAEPGSLVFLATDVAPGPTLIPRLGSLALGLTPAFKVRRVGVAPPNGKLDVTCTILCHHPGMGVPMYAQAFAFDLRSGEGCLSESIATMYFDQKGACGLGDGGCAAWTWAQRGVQAEWPAPYSPDDRFQDVFGTPDTDLTLLETLFLRGSSSNRLMRESTAALLNAQDPRVDYPLTTDQILFLFDLAVFDGSARSELRKSLTAYNYADCPIR